jgi:hypothetical protein
MSSYQNKPGFGNFFRNKKKDNPKAPDYTGELCTPDGQQWRIAGWLKEGKKGTFLSLKAEAPRGGEATEVYRDTPKKPQGGRAAMDDEIPF